MDSSAKEVVLSRFDFAGMTGEMIVSSGFTKTFNLALVRSGLALYSWVVLIFHIVYNIYAVWFFVYFTHWSFILLTLYLTMVAYSTWMYHQKGKDYVDENPILGNTRHCFKVWVFFEVISAAAFGLDIIYWTALYDGRQNQWTNFHVHGVNSLFIIIELFYSRMKFNKFHFVFLLAYILFYLVFMWIFYAASGYWVYFVFDFNKMYSVIWYLASLIVFAIAFGMFGLLVNVRNKMVSRVGPYV